MPRLCPPCEVMKTKQPSPGRLRRLAIRPRTLSSVAGSTAGSRGRALAARRWMSASATPCSVSHRSIALTALSNTGCAVSPATSTACQCPAAGPGTLTPIATSEMAMAAQNRTIRRCCIMQTFASAMTRSVESGVALQGARLDAVGARDATRAHLSLQEFPRGFRLCRARGGAGRDRKSPPGYRLWLGLRDDFAAHEENQGAVSYTHLTLPT